MCLPVQGLLRISIETLHQAITAPKSHSGTQKITEKSSGIRFVDLEAEFGPNFLHEASSRHKKQTLCATFDLAH